MLHRDVEAYVDGSSLGTSVGAAGGWGAIILYKSEDGAATYEKELSGGEEVTTNQRQEMTAALCALRSIRKGRHRVIIHSDSAYLVNGMTLGWMDNWKRNGWINTSGKEVANRDLWERLEKAVSRHPEVVWVKVKGHSKEPTKEARLHNLADRKASEARKHVASRTATVNS